MRRGMTFRMPRRKSNYRASRRIAASIVVGLALCTLWTILLFTYLPTNSWTSKIGALPLENFDPTYLEPIAPDLLQVMRLSPTPGRGFYLIYNVDLGINKTMYGYRDTTVSRPRQPGSPVVITWDPTQSEIPDAVSLSRYQFGWPFRMLSYDEITTGLSTNDPLVAAYHQKVDALAGAHRGLDRPAWLPSSIPLRRVPIAVNWVALFLNVVVWSVISFAILSIRPMIHAISVRRRKKLGLCIKCKYPLEGLSRCPECGTPRS